MFKLFTVILIIAINVLSSTSQYVNHKSLIGDPYKFDLNWNFTDTDIFIELQVKETNGWFFFGLASNETLSEGRHSLKKLIFFTQTLKINLFFSGFNIQLDEQRQKVFIYGSLC